MESESDNDIFKVALRLYYNESIRCEGNMVSLIQENIRVQNVNSFIERSIITTFSFFIDHGFCLALNPNDNFQHTIPPTWKDAIDTRIILGEERSSAIYFLQKKTQNFVVTFSSYSISHSVAVQLTRLMKHTNTTRSFPATLFHRDLDGLSDGEHASSFASYIWSNFKKAMKHALVKADQDLPPSTISSPLSLR